MIKVSHGRAMANNAEIDEGMLERLTKEREYDRLRRERETDEEKHA